VKKILIAIVVLAAAGVGARLRYVSSRDSLATQRDAVTESWNTVDAALRDYANLLPTLASQVKVSPKLAAQTQQTIDQARGVLNQLRPAQEKIQAYKRLQLESARLLLAADQDARLRADRKFLLLKEDLTSTDNRILVARRKYNEALERYNASLSVFPHNVAAAIGGFARNDAYFPTGLESRPPTKE